MTTFQGTKLDPWRAAARSTHARLRASRFAVERAELLDIHEGAVAQPRDVAAGVHELIAALEHVLPREAGMRHRAHRHAGALDPLFGAGDQRRHLRVPDVAHLTDG